jgi:hypothetical protein
MLPAADVIAVGAKAEVLFTCQDFSDNLLWPWARLPDQRKRSEYGLTKLSQNSEGASQTNPYAFRLEPIRKYHKPYKNQRSMS